MAKGGAVLLEPIMKVEVTKPEEYLGDVIGSLNAKRGQIQSMDDIGGGKIVKALVTLQSFVLLHRDVVTTLCSSRSMSSVQRTFRRRFLQTRTLNSAKYIFVGQF